MTSAWLRSEAGDAWHAITHDEFTESLAAGTLDLTRLRKYLVQDHRFLDAFTVLLASMIAAAPSLEDRIPGAQFLGLITSKENTYFERAFAALGVTPEDRKATLDEPATTRFISLMRGAALSGKLHVMLAVLVVAEWSYFEWADRVTPAPDLPFYFQEWIDLHRGAYFSSVVAYLRNLLDGLDLSDVERNEARDAFLAAVKNEGDFWAMAAAAASSTK